MQESRPSRTALRVAMRRAGHQVLDSPKVFDDPIALQILGPDAVERVRAEKQRFSRFSTAKRAFMAARSRYAEDQLARAMARGVKQYVILGAGLDTFAYRNPHASLALRVFEVDYPATQEWKREQLATHGISVPNWLTFAPIDFERQTLPGGLREAGFAATEPAFFSWLGVTMYLERTTVMNTFRFIASCGRGGGVAFDYAVPRESLSWMGRLALDALSSRVGAFGEPFRSFFAPGELRAELESMGFREFEDLGASEINARYFANRADGLRVSGELGRLMSALT
jgi:methyltransferase (TIGR00027 family)